MSKSGPTSFYAYGKAAAPAIGAGVLIAFLGAAPAQATVIEIGGSTSSGGPITVLATGTNTQTVFNGAFGGLDINLIGSNDVEPSLPRFDTTALNTRSSGGSGTVWFYVTELGLTATSPKSFTSGLTQNDLPSGWTVTETTWLDASNTAFGMGTMLATHSAPPLFAVSSTSGPFSLTGPYSLTEEFEISFNGVGTATSTEKILGSAIPEPGTWAMMLMGFAGLGYAGFRGGRKPRLEAM